MYLTEIEKMKLEEEMKVYATHAGRVNKVLSFFAKLFGLYDFGGGSFIAPSPETMNLNGKKCNVYIIVFEDGK